MAPAKALLRAHGTSVTPGATPAKPHLLANYRLPQTLEKRTNLLRKPFFKQSIVVPNVFRMRLDKTLL